MARFKVGDIVRRTELSLRYKALNPELRVSKVISIEGYGDLECITVEASETPVRWHSSHWELDKNTIIKTMISDL